MQRKIIYFLTITALFVGLNFFVAHIASQTKPFTMGQILRAIASVKEKRITEQKIINDIRKQKVDFPLTKENEKLLRDEGANNEIIEAIRQNSPPAPTPTPTPKLIPTATPTKTPISVSTPTPTPTSKPTPTTSGKEFKNSIGMEFVYIPNGSFEMGSNDGDADEKPVHRVTISKGFYMGKYEVTQEEYEKLMGTNPSYLKNCPRCPVEMVSWDDAQDFVRKLNKKNEGTYRLPTEAEWEYAARAGTATKYSFGNGESQIGVYAWYSANWGGETHECGTRQPNDFGLYDIHGNVWEWTQDWYGDYQSGSITNPTGASSGSNRAFRGGSCANTAAYLRSAYRASDTPSFRSRVLGFRVVRTQ